MPAALAHPASIPPFIECGGGLHGNFGVGQAGRHSMTMKKQRLVPRHLPLLLFRRTHGTEDSPFEFSLSM
jgi:hypothetical protein